MRQPIDRNLAFDFVRSTEAAALACAHWMGRGNGNAADQAAVDAMRFVLASVGMDGVVVTGEGEKDKAPMLYDGEHLGTGEAPSVDIAVDPIDGTRLLASGMPNAVSAVAVAERGTMFDPSGIFYMDKLAVGPSARGSIDINDTVANNLRRIAKTKGFQVEDLTVVVLDRDRHAKLIAEIRETGARIKMIPHGDLSAGLMPAIENTGVDVLMGIGGAPEALITACALKCIGGEIQCKLWAGNEPQMKTAAARGLDLNKVMSTDELVSTREIFFAVTGVTTGELLRGVRYTSTGAITHSLVMRGRSGTVRFLESTHSLDKLRRLSGGESNGRN